MKGKGQANWYKIQKDKRNKEIDGLGYMGGYEQSDLKGITHNRPEKTSDGINLYVSGQGPEAFLMDMKGDVLHKWSYPWSEAFPNAVGGAGDYWLAAFVYPNGDLLAIYEDFGFVKLNKDSELLWAKPIRAHHDVWLSPDGKIYVLTRKRTKLTDFRFKPQIKKKKRFSDYVTILDSDGTILKEFSILKAVKNSEFAPMLKLVHSGDIFHTNTLQIIKDPPPGLPEAFQEGRALISMRRLNFVGVMDLQEETLVWGRSSLWQGQHDPEILPNGNMLVFDNRKGGGYSRLIEMDPNNSEIKWELSGKTDVPFYAAMGGRNQRLSNGNILVTSTTEGRAFEVTPDKEIVWEYYVPHRLEKNGEEYIASLYDFKRLPPDYFDDWLKRSERSEQ
ncbi:MAG: arylsulfotransferase family protein [bacterium]